MIINKGISLPNNQFKNQVSRFVHSINTKGERKHLTNLSNPEKNIEGKFTQQEYKNTDLTEMLNGIF